MTLPTAAEMLAEANRLQAEFIALEQATPEGEEPEPDARELAYCLHEVARHLRALAPIHAALLARRRQLADAREVLAFNTDPKTRNYWYTEAERLHRLYHLAYPTGTPASDQQAADYEAMQVAHRMYRCWVQADSRAAQAGALD